MFTFDNYSISVIDNFKILVIIFPWNIKIENGFI